MGRTLIVGGAGLATAWALARRGGSDDLLLEELARRWGRVPPAAPAAISQSSSGIRTRTSEGRFGKGPDGDVAGLFWAAGLGGHGRMCGAAAGGIAAVVLVGEALDDPAAAACDPGRLALASSAQP